MTKVCLSEGSQGKQIAAIELNPLKSERSGIKRSKERKKERKLA